MIAYLRSSAVALLAVLAGVGLASPAWAACSGWVYAYYTDGAAARSACVAAGAQGGSNDPTNDPYFNMSWTEYLQAAFVPAASGACYMQCLYPSAGGACGGGMPNKANSGECKPACAAGMVFSATTGSCDAPSCSGGTVSNGQCTCPSGQYNSGGICMPNPGCPSGQAASSSGVCTPSTPEPVGGASATVGVVVCQLPVDCASSTANWTPFPATVNNDGWTWKASTPSNCYGTTTVTCNTNIVYGAGGPAPSSALSTVAAATGVPDVPTTQSLTCPIGYTLDAAGVCQSAGTAGTPSTSSSPGTPGTPGSSACPVGYAAAADGTCVQQSGGSVYANCPAGYSRDPSGNCVGNDASGTGSVPGVYGAGAGSGPNSVGSCGGPGQSDCNTQINEANTPSSYDYGREKAVLDKATSDAAGQFDVLTRRNSLPWSWTFTLPQGSCSPLTLGVIGQEKTFDWCPLLGQVRSALAYFYYVLFALYLWRSVTAGASQKVA